MKHLESHCPKDTAYEIPDKCFIWAMNRPDVCFSAADSLQLIIFLLSFLLLWPTDWPQIKKKRRERNYILSPWAPSCTHQSIHFQGLVRRTWRCRNPRGVLNPSIAWRIGHLHTTLAYKRVREMPRLWRGFQSERLRRNRRFHRSLIDWFTGSWNYWWINLTS